MYHALALLDGRRQLEVVNRLDSSRVPFGLPICSFPYAQRGRYVTAVCAWEGEVAVAYCVFCLTRFAWPLCQY